MIKLHNIEAEETNERIKNKVKEIYINLKKMLKTKNDETTIHEI